MKMELRKLLSLVLAVVLVVGLCPTAGLAEEVASPSSISQDGGAPQEPALGPEGGAGTDTSPATDSSLASASSLSSLEGLTGNDLYAALKAFDSATFADALAVLTLDQIASLKAVMSAAEYAAWFPVDISKLSGEELAAYLNTLTGDTLRAAFAGLTKEQFESLDVTALYGEMLYVYLLTLYTADLSAFCTTFKELPQEQYDSLLSVADPAVINEWLALVTAAPFTVETNFIGSVGGLLENTAASSGGLRMKALMAAPTYTEPTLPATVSSEALVTSKTAHANGDGTYNITITAYTSQTNIANCDVVLLLDISLSMNDTIYTYTAIYNPSTSSNHPDYFVYVNGTYYQLNYSSSNGWYYTISGSSTRNYVEALTSQGNDPNPGNTTPAYQFYTRSGQTKLAALKTAANNFLDAMNTQTPNSRVAIVSYSSGATNLSGGFKTVSSSLATLHGYINGLNLDYDTHPDIALNMAKSIFSADHPTTTSKAVVLFTDGVPTNGSATFNETVANNAITYANDLKNTYSATIYTVGLFSGTERSDARVDRFMSYVSSNYNGRTAPLKVTDTNVTPNYSKYYVYTNDASVLNSIFVAIGNGLTINNATVKDVLTRQFELTEASIAAIRAADGAITTDSYGRTVITWPHTFTPVTVTNGNPVLPNAGYFSFTIVVQRKDPYIGGNTAYSNYSDSGVYSGSTAIENFDMPTLNAPILYDGFVSSAQNIYVGASVSLPSLFSTATYKINGVEYPIDGVFNKYVDIAYTLKQGSTTMGTYTIPAGGTSGTWAGQNGFGDTFTPTDSASYDVIVTITPVSNGNNPAVGTKAVTTTLPGAITINVYKPVITMRNLYVYLTNTPTLTDAVYSVVWKNGGTLADTSASAMGPYPALTYAFSPSFPSYPTEDTTPVNVATVTRTDISYPIPAGQRTIVNASGVSDTAPHFTVYVLKPTVGCLDSTMFLGDDPVAWSTYLSTFSRSWTSMPTGAKLSGGDTAPTLSLSIDLSTLHPSGASSTQFAPVAGGDYNFKIAVSVGSTPITTYTTINNPVAGETDHHFTIHVVTGTLIITKAFGQNSVDLPKVGESFIFTIAVDKDSDGTAERTFKAIIQGAGSTTITGLPKGTYTVTEDTGWSWRYDSTAVDQSGGKVLGNKVNGNYVTSIAAGVTNTNRVPFWLSGESWAVNRFNMPPTLPNH